MRKLDRFIFRRTESRSNWTSAKINLSRFPLPDGLLVIAHVGLFGRLPRVDGGDHTISSRMYVFVTQDCNYDMWQHVTKDRLSDYLIPPRVVWQRMTWLHKKHSDSAIPRSQDAGWNFDNAGERCWVTDSSNALRLIATLDS